MKGLKVNLDRADAALRVVDLMADFESLLVYARGTEAICKLHNHRSGTEGVSGDDPSGHAAGHREDAVHLCT